MFFPAASVRPPFCDPLLGSRTANASIPISCFRGLALFSRSYVLRIGYFFLALHLPSLLLDIRITCGYSADLEEVPGGIEKVLDEHLQKCAGGLVLDTYSPIMEV